MNVFELAVVVDIGIVEFSNVIILHKLHVPDLEEGFHAFTSLAFPFLMRFFCSYSQVICSHCYQKLHQQSQRQLKMSLPVKLLDGPANL